MQPHILIVDDDREIRHLLASYLEGHDMRALTAADGKEMSALLASTYIDLIVLDLMLPGEDGLTLCRNLRAHSAMPIIMLTARGDKFDRIVGLEMGADDYVPKPFEPRELLARVRNVLRRTHSLPPNLQPDTAKRFRFAGWTLDTEARYLLSPHNVVVSLSNSEYCLLRVFLMHPNCVLTRDQLSNLTHKRDWDPLERKLDLQVSRLRQKLGDDARTPHLIKTVRSEGYLLNAFVDVEQ